ncbi:BMC domain-containing protein [Clostridium fallax]|uniref:BMC domain-containing protein n=1 Tax=Clostridium fallax TaxID=1533 RepID=A0A1M4XBY4_9CLOT|nr:BMC domain-containing protein [Clostridium fallax]SHE90885.1 BMC domain-containing protein [Clostridium fallax]SQB05991.1 microcompartments protein [Clostridium fallax]
MNAVGIIEVFGLTAAIVAADAACKAANVTIEAIDNNKPANADKLLVPVLIMVKLKGSISDIEVAIKAAEKAANKITSVNSKTIIPKIDNSIDFLIKKSCINK